MAIRGKNINVFLMDGVVTERIKCTLANWTGVAYKIPRTRLKDCKGRKDLKQSGVYFLLRNAIDGEGGTVYIGQASARKNGEGLLCRLQEHLNTPEEDYWTEAIALTTSNNSLGPTEISYLEHRFYELARKANRYEVKNNNDPNPGNITEEKKCELEDFIDNAKIILGILGHKVLEPKINKEDRDVLYLERNLKDFGPVKATGKQTAEGFVVLPGSQIAPKEDENIPASIKIRRAKAPVDQNRRLTEEVQFSSPTYAAIYVIGKSEDGLTKWKNKNGVSLKDIESGK